MDSLTQIVLGAAVGEVIAGRRLGNRAMLWGAVAGTIPDLDVVTNLWLSDLDALTVHRGLSHSLLFAVVAPFVLAWIVRAMYRARQKVPELSLSTWYWLFFWAFVTHILLDCFTSYGTQVLMPFSHYRVAFNTIAVADPAYTLPFALCVFTAAWLKRGSRWRKRIIWIGIGLSSAYLVMTVYNKHRVDTIFAAALEHRKVSTERFRTSPTILNNILWNCTAEGPDAFYVGLYSLFDTDPELHHLNRLPKQKAVIDSIRTSRAYRTLYWFSDGYLLAEARDDRIILTDIRFGALTDTITSGEDYVFVFNLTPGEDGWEVDQYRPQAPDMQALKDLIKRAKGY